MLETMRWRRGALELLDQTLLPHEVVYTTCYDYRKVGDAIARLVVRGAPAIGAAAGFAMVLGLQELRLQGLSGEDLLKKLAAVRDELIATRPTAVNLAWAAGLLYQEVASNIAQGVEVAYQKAEALAQKIHRDDIAANEKMGRYGSAILPEEAIVLTHCNAGAIATCGWGTALGVIRQAHAEGKLKMVYADETRPLLQGARLTAFELLLDKIPVTLITDSMAAWTMRTQGVNAVVVGADRIAMNGDTANKIGTYGVALAAKAHGIPFYIAAPLSTFDFTCTSGEDIPIEERKADEIRYLGNKLITTADMPVFNPAFDVTPHELIAGIITEYGVVRAPYTQNIRILKETVEASK